MFMTETISIVIPVYHVEEYLKQCLDSVLAQTYQNLQIIIVNDGSDDNSYQIIEQFQRKDSRVEVICQDNQGLSAARNAGIYAANGEYIIFIDSDDFVAPNFVEILYREIRDNVVDISVCGYVSVDEDGNEIKKINDNQLGDNEKRLSKQNFEEENINTFKNHILQTDILTAEEFWDKYESNEHLYCVVAWNKIYRRSLFDEIQYEVGKLHEDEYILHEILRRVNRIACCYVPLYYYRTRKKSIVNSNSEGRSVYIIEAYLNRMEYFLEEKNYKRLHYTFQEITDILEPLYQRQNEVIKLTKRLKKILKDALKQPISPKFRSKAMVFLIDTRFYYEFRTFVRKRKENRT